MTLKYDQIGDAYRQAENCCLKKYVTKPTFRNLLGDLKAKRVIDLACGSGDSTRIIKKAGAKEALGVDISKVQIQLAREIEKKNPLGIKYVVGDVRNYDFSTFKPFDIATAEFLLHYSKTKQELQTMCSNMFKVIKSKGHFIVINSNPDNPEQSNKKYEVLCIPEKPLVEGGKLKTTYLKGEHEFCTFYTHYWKKQTYEKALKNAGFINIKWHNIIVSEEGIKKYGKEFWRDIIEKPDIVGITCQKP